jgi:hypothetical protein
MKSDSSSKAQSANVSPVPASTQSRDLIAGWIDKRLEFGANNCLTRIMKSTGNELQLL